MALSWLPLVKAVIGKTSLQKNRVVRVHCQASGVGDGEFADDKSCIEAVRKYLGFFLHSEKTSFLFVVMRGLQLAKNHGKN